MDAWQILLTLTLAVLPIVYFLRFFQKQSPQITSSNLVIETLQVHPIKSCRGIQVEESGYSAEGLDYDRRWVIVDAETHKFCTAREFSNLVLVTPSIHKSTNTLTVTFPAASGLPSFDVPLDPTDEELSTWDLASDVQIWKSITDGYIVPNPSAHSLLSTYLQKPVLLLLKGPSRRAVLLPSDPETLATLPENSRTAFADGFPILIVNRWSIEDVESKVVLSTQGGGGEEWEVKPPLEGEIKDKWLKGEGDYLRRTRGNIVVGGEGGKAWMEDRWGVVRLGEGELNRLIVASLCGRCQLPNVDPESGVSHPSVPFKVISKFRRVDPRQKYTPCFGVNAVPIAQRGMLRVGDKVRVETLNDWVLAE